MPRHPGNPLDPFQEKVSTRHRARIIKILLRGPLTVAELAQKIPMSRQAVYNFMEEEEKQSLPQIEWVGSKLRLRQCSRAHDVSLNPGEIAELEQTYRAVGSAGPLYRIKWKAGRDRSEKLLVYRVISGQRIRYDVSATHDVRENKLKLENLNRKPLDLSTRIM